MAGEVAQGIGSQFKLQYQKKKKKKNRKEHEQSIFLMQQIRKNFVRE
jgi:hypothetical protein